MSSPLTVDIPGPPVSWHRAVAYGGKRLTPAKQRTYQAHVRACAMRSRAMHQSPPPMNARMRVTVLFCAATRGKRDVDNAAKTALDACNGVLWDDDSQVDVLVVERLEPDAKRARLVMVVEVCEGLRSVADLARELAMDLLPALLPQWRL